MSDSRYELVKRLSHDMSLLTWYGTSDPDEIEAINTRQRLESERWRKQMLRKQRIETIILVMLTAFVLVFNPPMGLMLISFWVLVRR